MEELKPCPFCGGEAFIAESRGYDGVCVENLARVECCDCGAGGSLICEHASREEVRNMAIDAWNRRAERTCNVESSHVEKEIGYYAYLEVELSCGHAFTWDDVKPPDYCPNCGAKVIGETE